jgi:hypothetical protein
MRGGLLFCAEVLPADSRGAGCVSPLTRCVSTANKKPSRTVPVGLYEPPYLNYLADNLSLTMCIRLRACNCFRGSLLSANTSAKLIAAWTSLLCASMRVTARSWMRRNALLMRFRIECHSDYSAENLFRCQENSLMPKNVISQDKAYEKSIMISILLFYERAKSLFLTQNCHCFTEFGYFWGSIETLSIGVD